MNLRKGILTYELCLTVWSNAFRCIPEKGPYTLSLKSLSGHSSVCYKTSLNTGGVGQAGAAPPTSKLEKFLSWPLALSMSIYSNFQINGASGETLKPPDPRFLKQNRGLEVSKFLPKLHLFGNCYKSAYLEPRALTKTSPI